MSVFLICELSKVAWRVPLVFPEYRSSLMAFIEGHFAQSSIICVELCGKRTNIDLQSNTQKTKDRATRTSLKSWVTHVLPSCYYSYTPGDKSWMRKVPVSVYDKWNISVVICDIDITYTVYTMCVLLD